MVVDLQASNIPRHSIRSATMAAILAFSCQASRAEEPRGCDAFKWPLQKEAALLQAPSLQELAADGTAQADGKAYGLKLIEFTETHLPMPPERKPKISPSTAGFATFMAPTAGAYQVVVSQAAWIDVVQDGHYVKPSAFSGATDCPGVRKSIRVDLAATPFTLQISGASATSIGMLVEPTPR